MEWILKILWNFAASAVLQSFTKRVPHIEKQKYKEIWPAPVFDFHLYDSSKCLEEANILLAKFLTSRSIVTCSSNQNISSKARKLIKEGFSFWGTRDGTVTFFHEKKGGENL